MIINRDPAYNKDEDKYYTIRYSLVILTFNIIAYYIYNLVNTIVQSCLH